MSSVTYDFLHPEHFDKFVPEVVTEKRTQDAQMLFLIVGTGIILAGLGYLCYQCWIDKQLEEA